MHTRLEATMIYVTHDQVEAMTMGDRIAVINEGVLQQVGTPKELYEAPQNRFVAGFIGLTVDELHRSHRVARWWGCDSER